MRLNTPLLRPNGRNKHNAKPVKLDGHRFDSGAEAQRYLELKLLERLGRISGLVVHPAYPVEINGIHVCNVILDFTYRDHSGCDVYEDVKGYDNPMSKLKRKMVEAQYGIDVTLIRRRRKHGH